MSDGAGRGGTELTDTPGVFEATLRLQYSGLWMICRERIRQVKEEGFDSFHDDQHKNGELAQAAAYYLGDDDAFPEDWDPKWMKREGVSSPTDEDLAKAGALIAAELDRRKRARRGWHPHMDRR